ncbi:MAG: hypothetical protein AMJ54_02450 [Deltaproteobacteria bacterium SG8_13]|nr:MAG: hypothetical protein AMJ54_02450 [Deltaproteobacteria bacterium SG8_13]
MKISLSHPRSPFSTVKPYGDMIVQINDLDRKGFREWLFCPQMLFGASDKWWGQGGGRGNSHEGLDIGTYRDRYDGIQHLDETTTVPAAVDGVVAAMIDDFLGKTVILRHCCRDGADLLSLYGHTQPRAGLRIDRPVTAGERIATLMRPADVNFSVSTHLHLSFVRCTGSSPVEDLHWNTIGAIPGLTFIDPLPVIGCRYRVVDIPSMRASKP